jgi:hypothetical protein
VINYTYKIAALCLTMSSLQAGWFWQKPQPTIQQHLVDAPCCKKLMNEIENKEYKEKLEHLYNLKKELAEKETKGILNREDSDLKHCATHLQLLPLYTYDMEKLSSLLETPDLMNVPNKELIIASGHVAFYNMKQEDRAQLRNCEPCQNIAQSCKNSDGTYNKSKLLHAYLASDGLSNRTHNYYVPKDIQEKASVINTCIRVIEEEIDNKAK